MIGLQQLDDGVRTDVTAAASDENAHLLTVGLDASMILMG
jgi:hypothetical protein